MEITRREALGTAALAGVGLPLLAACGTAAAGNTDTSGGTGTGAQGGDQSGSQSGGTTIKETSVPVGGGVIQGGVVVTQPTKGTFKAFSSVCTHQGCPVSNITGGTINCLCHGSSFSITDGSVQGGPAPSPLPALKFTAAKGSITVQG